MDNDDGLEGNAYWSNTVASLPIFNLDTNLHEFLVNM